MGGVVEKKTMVLKRVRRGISEVRDRVESERDTIDDLMEGARELVCDVWKNSPAQWIPTSDLLGVRSFYDNVVCDLDDEDKPKTDNDSIQKEEDEVPEELQNCDGAEFKITFFVNSLARIGSRSTCERRTTETEVFVVAPVSSITYEKIDPQNLENRTVEATIQDANGEKTEEIYNPDSVSGNKYFDGECPRILGSHAIIQDWGIENIELESDPDERPECGAPQPPPPAPPYGDEDPVEEDTVIDINIEGDDKFINKEQITINKDKRTVEGDKYEIYFEGDDVVFEYDSNDPPGFVPPDTDEFVGPPDIRDLLPDGLGDIIPTPGEFWRDVFDRIADLIPTPLPGVSAADILDAIEELEDEEEETETISATLQLCQDGELVGVVISAEAPESQASVFQTLLDQVVDARSRKEQERCGQFIEASRDVEVVSEEDGILSTETEEKEIPLIYEPLLGNLQNLANKNARLQASQWSDFSEAVRTEITTPPNRGTTWIAENSDSTKFPAGWIQFLRDGESYGEKHEIQFKTQIFVKPTLADDFIIAEVNNAEIEAELINWNKEETTEE